jgi:hypothetical protein
MNTRQNTKSGYSIEQQLSTIDMSQHVRDAILNDAHLAEAFVDAIMWVCGKFERPDASVFAKPSPKY